MISTVYQENSPELIYFMTLYNIFNEFLEDVSEDVLPNEATGFKDSVIWNKLYNFQKNAALAIINKLEQYNGCILADSVGLGKTFTALPVIKYYEGRNKNVLVLCPKKLSENWMTYRGNLINNPLAADRLRYDVLYHTDLSRDSGNTAIGLPIERINWGNYDLVVIDESHNFRNGNGTNSKGGEKENRYMRLMNRVIKPGVRTKVLMLSATPVNNRFYDLRNQLALAYEGNPAEINEKLKTKSDIDTIFRQAQKKQFELYTRLRGYKQELDKLKNGKKSSTAWSKSIKLEDKIMDNLKMHTPNLADENYKKLAALFPNAVTETVDENGEVVRAIDADVLRQEISATVVEGPQERYQFTWPDKKKSVVLANQPIAKTLRLDREKSVGRDGTPGSIDTKNIYIEGDNLDALKLLQETYLGKVKMIYIDPPYNTGSDAFVYDDNSSISGEEFSERSGQYDEDGNMLFDMRTNNEANGRFHTDWLNMLYPRLRLAKDLLTDDGVIFISIDDNEVSNLKKICDEIFGVNNFVACINWKGRGGRQDSKYYAAVHEYILCYAKKIVDFNAGEEIKSGDIYPKYDEEKKRFYKTQLLRKWGSNSRREDRPNLFYPIKAPDGTDVYPMLDNSTYSAQNSENFGCWRHGASTMEKNIKDGKVEFVKASNDAWIPYEKIYAPAEGEEATKKYTTWIDETNDGTKVVKSLFESTVFDYPKTPSLILRFLKMADVETGDIVLDFFSGSATTAHAVMQLNAEDGGHRKFIMVQLPEVCDEKSEAYKAGYKNICEIGEERIRRAGKKIKEDNKDKENIGNLDVGFRVFRVDSSNMKDVYYTPAKYKQEQMEMFADNIKEDRTPEDLLFQVMLDLGIMLSSDIEETEIAGKRVFSVAGGYLIACFDSEVTDETVTEIAKQHPFYAVFRDSGMANDSVMTNFEQIFETYSPRTQRKVL